MIRFIFVALFIYIIYKVVKVSFKFKKMLVKSEPEICPNCQSVIQLSDQNMICPRCGIQLGRNEEGKLLIRIN
jgi:predicted amidophosphoribosyltransferase